MIRVSVRIPELEAPYVQRGTAVEVRADALPEEKFSGRVARSAGVVGQDRSMLAEINLPNPSHKLQPGMFVRVSLALQTHRKVLAVPVAALLDEKGKYSVFQGASWKSSEKAGRDRLSQLGLGRGQARYDGRGNRRHQGAGKSYRRIQRRGRSVKILLIEDEPALGRVLEEGLVEAGYLVDRADNGESGLQLALSGEYNALILDLMLPERDGLELCQEIRDRQVGTPVLMVTARDTLADKLAGFDCGGDDYLTKPFEFAELLARLSSLVRRAHQGRQRVLSVTGLELDTQTREVRREGKLLNLSPREYGLLAYLMYNKGRPLTRNQILSSVWPTDYTGGSNVVDVFIRYLRRKLDDGWPTKLIHTVPGTGYSLREPGDAGRR